MLLLKIFHHLFLLLPPEIAHALGIFALKIYQTLLKKNPPKTIKSYVVLDRPLALKVSSRLGLAAGLDKNAEVYWALSQLGFGFIEVGTVTPLPQEGNPKPRLWRMQNQSLVNHMGFNSVGVDKFRKNLLRYRNNVSCPILANIGKNRTTDLECASGDYAFLFQALKDVVDGFVVNLSSPNTPGLRNLQNEEFLREIARHIPSVPTYLKLSPDLEDDDILHLSEWIREESRFAGIVLTNTSRLLAEGAGMKVGGLSGKPLFERSLNCVSIARKGIGKKTVIGVGGISSRQDAKKMFEAGADLIEIYTSFIYGGPAIVQELTFQ